MPVYNGAVTKTEGKVEFFGKQAGDDGNRKQGLTDIERDVEKTIKSRDRV